MSVNDEGDHMHNRHVALMKVQAQFTPIAMRLARDLAMLTANMNLGELKASEARLLRFATYLVNAESPAVGDF